MNPGSVAKLLNISTSTLHRWTEHYAEFLIADATPPKGQARVFSNHDVRVLLFVCQRRGEGMSQDAIKQALLKSASNAWHGLPDLPPDWQSEDQNVMVPISLIERLRQEQTAHAELVERQRKMLQMTEAALQLRTEQQATSEQLARRFLQRQRFYHMALIVMFIVICAVVVIAGFVR